MIYSNSGTVGVMFLPVNQG